MGEGLGAALVVDFSLGGEAFDGGLETVSEAGSSASFWDDSSVVFSSGLDSGSAFCSSGDVSGGDDTAPSSSGGDFSRGEGSRAGADVDLLSGDASPSGGGFSESFLAALTPFVGGDVASDALSDPGCGVPVAAALSSSSDLVGLSSSLAFRSPTTVPDWPTFSTAMKLARTLDSGLTGPEPSDPVGERPRDGGEETLFWLLLSNLASKLRTPWGRFSAMAALKPRQVGQVWHARSVGGARASTAWRDTTEAVSPTQNALG